MTALALAVDVDAADRALAGASVVEVLAWAAAHAGPRVAFATGFGAEGCAIIDHVARAGLPIELVTLDTGLLFPETYALWRALEAHYGVTIHAVRPAETVVEQALSQGDALWARDPDRCCARRKVVPLAAALAGRGGWITAIRRDQTPERAAARVVERDVRHGIVKVNPLVAWTHEDVWGYLYANDVPYSPLHDQGYPSIGCRPCTSAIVPGEQLRAGRWRGSHKRECGVHFDLSDASVPVEKTLEKT